MGTNKKHRRTNIRQTVFLVVGLLLIVFGVRAYWDWQENSKLVGVTFSLPNGKKSDTFRLEVAATPETRARGLMFRKGMASDRGMIFIFPEERVQQFWMKDTYLSLDMIFLDKDLKVVGVLDKVPPLNDIPRRVDSVSKYVIELGAGIAAANGIVTNAKAFPDKPLPGGAG